MLPPAANGRELEGLGEREGRRGVSQLRSSRVYMCFSPGSLRSPGAGSCCARFTGWETLGGLGGLGGSEGEGVCGACNGGEGDGVAIGGAERDNGACAVGDYGMADAGICDCAGLSGK